MLSRVANSIYWMTRYVERAESLARFVDVTLNVALDQPGDVEAQWQPLVLATGDEKQFFERYSSYTPDNVLRFLTFDRDYDGSIITSLSIARENARTVREVISSEAWEVLNEFYLMLKRASTKLGIADEIEFFNQVKRYGHLLDGVLQSTMTRDLGWWFAHMGRYLERADKTSRIIDVKYFTLLPSPTDVDTTLDDLVWSAVLRSVDAFEMYRKRYHSLTLSRIVSFMVLDAEFPRSVHFCVREVGKALRKITPANAGESYAISLVQEIESQLTGATASGIINNGVHEFIDSMQQDFNRLGASINESFFARRKLSTAEQ
ncbi:MAG TPA: hypothetical protein DDW52_09905 [Planctomycetaceae bacterium]|nr:hypothetical protein [Planctomycetaceae bacterium]